jgi:hypothetical protein
MGGTAEGDCRRCGHGHVPALDTTSTPNTAYHHYHYHDRYHDHYRSHYLHLHRRRRTLPSGGHPLSCPPTCLSPWSQQTPNVFGGDVRCWRA